MNTRHSIPARRSRDTRPCCRTAAAWKRNACGAIPWVLLAAKTIGPEGSFSKTTSIQRVNTVGGVAPAAGCTRETAGTAVRVKYTADYFFFTIR